MRAADEQRTDVSVSRYDARRTDLRCFMAKHFIGVGIAIHRASAIHTVHSVFDDVAFGVEPIPSTEDDATAFTRQYVGRSRVFVRVNKAVVRQKSFDRIESDRWNCAGQRLFANARFTRVARAASTTISVAALKRQPRLTIYVAEVDGVTWVDQVRVPDLWIDLPKLWPNPGVVQEALADVPQRVATNYRVAIGVVAAHMQRQVFGIGDRRSEQQAQQAGPEQFAHERNPFILAAAFAAGRPIADVAFLHAVTAVAKPIVVHHLSNPSCTVTRAQNPAMARLPILEFPDPRLRTKAKRIATVDQRIRALAADMLETMYDAPGIGLAAIQVGEPIRLIVIDISDDHSTPQVFINPTLSDLSGDQEASEGCLSIPGFYEPVVRADRVRVHALNLEGSEFELHAEGLLAQCIQHECDHLEGKLFVDHISPLKRQRIRQRMEKRHRAQA